VAEGGYLSVDYEFPRHIAVHGIGKEVWKKRKQVIVLCSSIVVTQGCNARNAALGSAIHQRGFGG
jgi:hypothetical protein